MAEKNVPISTVVDIATKQPYIEPSNVPLDDQTAFGGGGGGGGPVEPTVSMREYVDKADEAVEARLSAKIDTVIAKLDGLATKESINLQRTSIVHNVWGGAIAVVLGLLAVLSFGADRFDGGAAVSPQLSAVTAKQATVDADQNAQAKALDRKLDVIINQTAK